MNKYFILIAYATIIAAIGLMLLFGFWLLYPYKPVVFNNTPFPVNNKTYKTGDVLVYTVDYCKSTNINPLVTRYYVDGIIYMASSNLAIHKDVGCGKTNIQLIVPPSLMPGTYYMKIGYSYQMNPVRTVSVYAETQKFNIIE